MRCPERYCLIRHCITSPLIKNDEVTGEYNMIIENQNLAKCYEEECAAWDKRKKDAKR